MNNVSKALDTTIQDFGTMPDTNGWQKRHMREVVGYIGRTPTFAQSIVRMLAALAAYADCHETKYEASIGTDGVIGDAWLDSLRGVRALLNGETGGLDCGVVDATILAMAKAAGFEEEV
jgi:hypothetical protein